MFRQILPNIEHSKHITSHWFDSCCGKSYPEERNRSYHRITEHYTSKIYDFKRHTPSSEHYRTAV